MTDLNQAVRQAAEMLRRAAEERLTLSSVRELLPAGDLAAAYAVQNANTEHYLAAGRRLVGRKVGLTSRAVQSQLGVDQPDYGVLFADMQVNDAETVPLSRLIQPRVEAEVAFVLGRDLTSRSITMTDVTSAVAYVLPAIEIVDSRIAHWKIGILDTIADNASSGLFVLGNDPKPLAGLDLRTCGMVMMRGADVVSVGVGAACLGHPLRATLWLAQTAVTVGRPLRSGEVILSGALGPMTPATAGDDFTAEIAGLGTVRVSFRGDAA